MHRLLGINLRTAVKTAWPAGIPARLKSAVQSSFPGLFRSPEGQRAKFGGEHAPVRMVLFIASAVPQSIVSSDPSFRISSHSLSPIFIYHSLRRWLGPETERHLSTRLRQSTPATQTMSDGYGHEGPRPIFTPLLSGHLPGVSLLLSLQS